MKVGEKANDQNQWIGSLENQSGRGRYPIALATGLGFLGPGNHELEAGKGGRMMDVDVSHSSEIQLLMFRRDVRLVFSFSFSFVVLSSYCHIHFHVVVWFCFV
jgi:hypothetical protein